MQVVIWIFFCVLMPLIGITYSLKLLAHFLIPRVVAGRVTRFVEIPQILRETDMQR